MLFFRGLTGSTGVLVTLRSMNVFVVRKSIYLMIHVVEGKSAYSSSQTMEMWWRENNRNAAVVVEEIKKKNSEKEWNYWIVIKEKGERSKRKSSLPPPSLPVLCAKNQRTGNETICFLQWTMKVAVNRTCIITSQARKRLFLRQHESTNGYFS